MPRIHPREQIVNEARADLHSRLTEWMQAHDLTDAEFFQVAGGIFGDVLAEHAKYMIRVDRHGDTDTPGGSTDDEPDGRQRGLEAVSHVLPGRGPESTG